MMILFASALTLVGTALGYLAHPNQILRARPLPRAAGWAGLVLAGTGLALWIVSHGALPGLSIALTLWMLVGVGLPYLAAWLSPYARPPEVRR